MKVNSLTHYHQSPNTSDYLSDLTDQTKIKGLVREKLIRIILSGFTGLRDITPTKSFICF